MIKQITMKLIRELEPLVKQKVFVEKGKIILKQDELVNNTYLLLSGKIKVLHLLHESELILTIYSDKNLILKPFPQTKTFVDLFRIETIEDSVLGVIPIKEIEKVSSLKDLILNYYDLFFQKTYLQMRDLLCNNKEKGLYSVLIRLANSYGEFTEKGVKINFKISNCDLAGLTGTTNETISRLLSKMKLKNLIENNHGIITIKNINYLRDTLNCNDCNINLCIF